MVKYLITAASLVSAMILFGGCSSNSSSSGGSTTQVSDAATTEPSIPSDSIFAKVKKGEERDQVFAEIGQPTSMNTYQTGKAFIPFHYGGGDDVRMQAHYKGVGYIVFSNDSSWTSGWSVIDIHYDPSESGY